MKGTVALFAFLVVLFVGLEVYIATHPNSTRVTISIKDKP